MKKKLSLIFLALFLFASASALALDDPVTSFHKIIVNGPSQEVCHGPKGDDNDTAITISRLVYEAPANSVSFRGYWGGERVTPLLTHPDMWMHCNYYSLPNFNPGCTVIIMGSIPQDASTPASADVTGYWYR